MLDLRRIRYFSVIVDCGSLSKAAQALGVAQPALSHSIASLEAYLGVKLLNRASTGVTTTEAGETLYRHACQILKQIDRAIGETRNVDGLVDGTVVVGVPVSTAAMMSLPVLRETMKRFPHIKLQINAIPSHMVPEMLRQGRIDLGIVFGDELTSDMEAEPLLDEELVYLLPPGRLAEGEIGRISLSEVADAPLMMPGAPNIIYKRLTAAFELIGRQPVILAEIDALTSIVEAVIEGVGAAVLPWAALRHAGNPVIDAYRITDPVLSRRMFLSHSTFSPLTRAAANIRDIVIQETQQLVRSGRWKAVSLTL